MTSLRASAEPIVGSCRGVVVVVVVVRRVLLGVVGVGSVILSGIAETQADETRVTLVMQIFTSFSIYE